MIIVAQGNSYRIISECNFFYIEIKIKNSEGDTWVPVNKDLMISSIRISYHIDTIIGFRIRDIIDFLQQNVSADYSKELPENIDCRIPENDIPF